VGLELEALPKERDAAASGRSPLPPARTAPAGSRFAAPTPRGRPTAQPASTDDLLGAADAVRRPTGRGINAALRREYDRTVASLRDQLGEAAFAAAWREGQALTVEQAVALAMSDDHDPEPNGEEPR